MNVKINNKNYVVKELGFRDMVKIEDMGFSLQSLIVDNKTFSSAVAFVGIVADCDKEEAIRLCEQHVLGGGQLFDIIGAFDKAMDESGFFKKFLQSAEDEEPKKTKSSVKTEK